MTHPTEEKSRAIEELLRRVREAMAPSRELDADIGLFWDYCEKVERLAERERKRAERRCNFCGALTDEGCELCEREKRRAD